MRKINSNCLNSLIFSLGSVDAEQMANLKFSENHNIVAYLSDPPAEDKEFRSMVHGLKNCILAHDFQANPIIYQELVKQVWDRLHLKKEIMVKA